MTIAEVARELELSQQRVHQILAGEDGWMKKSILFMMSFEIWEYRHRLQNYLAFQTEQGEQRAELHLTVQNSGQDKKSNQDSCEEILILTQMIEFVEQHGTNATRGALAKHREGLGLSNLKVLFEWGVPDITAQDKASVIRGAIKRISLGQMSGRCSNNHSARYAVLP